MLLRATANIPIFVPDAAYHRDKFDRGFTTVIDLLGPDHQGHSTHLKNFVKALGMSDDWLEIFIIQQVNLVDAGGNAVRYVETGADSFIPLIRLLTNWQRLSVSSSL